MPRGAAGAGAHCDWVRKVSVAAAPTHATGSTLHARPGGGAIWPIPRIVRRGQRYAALSHCAGPSHSPSDASNSSEASAGEAAPVKPPSPPPDTAEEDAEASGPSATSFAMAWVQPRYQSRSASSASIAPRRVACSSSPTSCA